MRNPRRLILRHVGFRGIVLVRVVETDRRQTDLLEVVAALHAAALSAPPGSRAATAPPARR